MPAAFVAVASFDGLMHLFRLIIQCTLRPCTQFPDPTVQTHCFIAASTAATNGTVTETAAGTGTTTSVAGGVPGDVAASVMAVAYALGGAGH